MKQLASSQAVKVRKASAILLLIAVLPAVVWAQPAADVPASCLGKAGGLTATVWIIQLPSAIEFDLLLANQGDAPLQFDPSTVVLRTAESTASPLTADETKRADRDYGAYVLSGLLFQGALLPFTLIAQLNFNRYVETRIFHAADIRPGQPVRGSLFFPLQPDGRSRAALDLGRVGLKMYCSLPRRDVDVDVPPAPPILTVSLNARGRSGPVEARVHTAEFGADYTALELSMFNQSAASAEIFMAMVNASLRDGAGVVYAARAVRSDFMDRIAALGSGTVRLVFVPLPASTAAASLRIPGVWFGPENSVDVTVELKF